MPNWMGFIFKLFQKWIRRSKVKQEVLFERLNLRIPLTNDHDLNQLQENFVHII